MGICIQAFRIRIGQFQSRQCSFKKNKVQHSQFKTYKYRRTFLFMTAIIAALVSIFYLSLFLSSSSFGRKNLVLRERFRSDLFVNNQSSLRWSQQGVKLNKLSKIINGNRRSLGYKLALWNCGRGLLPRSLKESGDFGFKECMYT